MTTLQPMTPASFFHYNSITMTTAASKTKGKAYKEGIAKKEEETLGNESEMTKSPPHGFNGNHEQTNEAEEEKEETMDDLSILADAAANSPVPSVKSDTLQTSADIPFPSSEGGNDKSAEAGSKRPALEQKKPPAKKSKKAPAKKEPSPEELQPTKRSTRARKLPTKLQQRPSSMTSSSSAMSAAAILVQVSSSKKDVKPAKKPKKKLVESSDSDIRGITMKRPGKWQAQFYYAGQSRYIGIFTSQEKAAQAYEIVRKMLKSDSVKPPSTCPKEAFEISRRAAYEGVGEPYPDTKKSSPAKLKKRPPPQDEESENDDDQGMLYY